MHVQIHSSWEKQLKNVFEDLKFIKLTEFVRKEYRTHKCYPPGNLIFEAFNRCPFDKVKVVILGQDPYHGKNQAHGLAFSVEEGVKHPPSLINIFREIEDDISEQERQKNLNKDFIELARSVYRKNDIRADLKKEINIRYNSAFIEEKSYRQY